MALDWQSVASPTLGWFGQTETKAWDAYKKKGGLLSFNAWMQSGKPSSPEGQLSQYGASILSQTGGIPKESTVAPAEGLADRLSAMNALRSVTEPTPTATQGVSGGGQQISPPNGVTSYTDAEGRVMTWNGMDNYIQTGFEPTKVYQGSQNDQYKQQQLELQKQQSERDEAYRQEQLKLEKDKATKDWFNQQAQRESQESQNQMMMSWYREQASMEQAQQEKQYKAQLAASPQSWLQYASYTGETPVVQPWMMPLSRQQYGWNTGQPITGWSQETGANMPELMTPSAQYWARMGPTAQQQYQGYSQAQSGINPQESVFRLRAGAPPSGDMRV